MTPADKQNLAADFVLGTLDGDGTGAGRTA